MRVVLTQFGYCSCHTILGSKITLLQCMPLQKHESCFVQFKDQSQPSCFLECVLQKHESQSNLRIKNNLYVFAVRLWNVHVVVMCIESDTVSLLTSLASNSYHIIIAVLRYSIIKAAYSSYMIIFESEDWYESIYYSRHRMKCVIYIIAINLVLLHQSYGQDGYESHQECPTWFIPTSSKNGTVCKCGDSLSHVIQCREQLNQSYLIADYCMTHSWEYNSTYAGKCPFNAHPNKSNDKQGYIKLPEEISEVNDFMCGKFNRTGLLCSLCRNGLGVVTLSPEAYCMECLNSLRGWVLYIFIILFPPTLFFFVIVFCQIKITSAEMNSFVLMSQLISIGVNQNPATYVTHQFFALAFITFCGFWNLDFFRFVFPRFCVSDNLSQIQVVALDYISALYPFILVILTYVCIELHDRDCTVLVWLWRPFRKCFTHVKFLRKLNPKSSIIHAFATFLLLSYSKLIFVSVSLLNFTTIYNETGDQIGPHRMYYNATIPYLSSEHIPFFILAICILAIVIAPFTLLLFLYPTRWFQRCIGCSGRGWHALHAFADVFHCSMKNGTNGTRDYRYFAGFYLFGRFIYIVLYILIDTFHTLVVGNILLIVFSLMVALLRPYKNNWSNFYECLFHALLALLSQLVLYQYYHVFKVPNEIFVLFLMLLFCCFIVYSAYRARLHRCMCCLRCLCQRLRNDHQTDREHIDYIFPDRLDNPGHYVDGYSSGTEELLIPESNRLQPASTYGSI